MERVPTHNPYRAGHSAPQHQPPRENTAWRQFINSPAWRRTSKWYLRNNPCCVRCKAEGYIVQATQVHHTRGQDMAYAFDPETLEALCASHHSQETRAEMNRGASMTADA